MAAKKEKLIITLTVEDSLDVRSFAKEKGFTLGELFRRAYELLKVVKIADSEGYEMVLRKKDDKNKEKIVLV